MDWLPIGKFLYPEKWYDAPLIAMHFYVNDKIYSDCFISNVFIYMITRNIESLNSKRNLRFTGFIFTIIGSFIFWNTGDAFTKYMQLI